MAAATDYQYLRFFTPSGIQTSIKSLPGPVVTMVGHDTQLFIVYHHSGVYHGHQSLMYMLIEVSTNTVIEKDCLPISPHSTLTWVGFSKTGIPLTFDSNGTLRGLYVGADFMWTPLFDSSAVGNTKADYYWPVGANDTLFYCVICKGEKYPTSTQPLINDMPQTIPFAELETTRSKTEENIAKSRLALEYARKNLIENDASTLLNISKQETSIDKLLLTLIIVQFF